MLSIIASKFVQLKNDERGASAIEYAVMAAILIVVIIAAINLLDLQGIFTNINTDINAAGTTP
jgi:pilus assembly protein Flp/PilA